MDDAQAVAAVCVRRWLPMMQRSHVRMQEGWWHTPPGLMIKLYPVCMKQLAGDSRVAADFNQGPPGNYWPIRP